MSSASKKQFVNLHTTIVLIACIISIVLMMYLKELKESKEKSLLEQSTSTLDITYRASIQKYGLLTKNIFTQQIKQDAVLELFYKGSISKGVEQNIYRGLLYKQLYPLYTKLKTQGIRQFQFNLENGDSFLRFHKPSKSGDNLFHSQKSIKIANTKHIIINSFETGKVASGFRNVFPIRYKNQYIGSVEISLTTSAITKTLSSLDKKKEYALIVNKKQIDSKIFKTQKFLYSISSINPNYLQEDANQYLIDSPKPLSNIAIQINKKLHSDKKLLKSMNQGNAYETFVKIKSGDYEVSFLPMKDIENQIEGYLISYRKVLAMPLIIKYFNLIAIFILIITLIIIKLIFIIKNKADSLNQQKLWFNSIIDTLAEGLYVMNIKGIIEYVNPEACKILGYKKEELLGKCAHSLFHSHYANQHIPQKDCSILKGVIDNKEFRTTEEFFTCKDKKVISVDLSSKFILEENQKSQIVTVFRDISENKRKENQMLLLTKALEASANAIIITDINAHVQWANASFEKLTGYKTQEVMGKDPKEFMNSGKQPKKFYEDMWKTILNKKPWKNELINKRKDGSFYHEELSITPVLDKNNDIQNFIAIKQDITDRKKAEENINHFAFYDPLTDLPNRRLLIEQLEKSIDAITRTNKSIAVLFLDLDKFKLLNDAYGHDEGDELLIQVAKRLNLSVRKQDIVSRIGGDEFIIVLDNLPSDLVLAKESAKNISKKIIKTIKTPFILKNITYEITVSIGVSIFNDDQLKTSEIFKQADLALYEAKEQGRGKACFYKSLLDSTTPVAFRN